MIINVGTASPTVLCMTPAPWPARGKMKPSATSAATAMTDRAEHHKSQVPTREGLDDESRHREERDQVE